MNQASSAVVIHHDRSGYLEKLVRTNTARVAAPAPRTALPHLPDAVRIAVAAIDARKGVDIEVLDLRGLNDAVDFFVIASGTSDAHVRGMADGVLRALDQANVAVHHAEGIQTGRWVLLDALDLVVHLFHPETREFYQLERLWQDAPRLLPGGSWA